MNTALLADNFYLSLVSFLLHAKQQAILVSSELGITSMQALTLLMIDEANPPSMSGFCKLYVCDASNITGIVDGLEQKGLVSRRPHPTDRRIKIIHLEAAGKKLQAKILERLGATSGPLFANLTSTELQQFAHLIQKLNPKSE